MVGCRDEVYAVVPDAANDVAGKSGNAPFSKPARERRTCFGISGDPLRRPFHRLEEPEAEPLEVRLIETPRFPYFLPGFRVENRFLHGRSRLARNSAKTS